MTFAVQEWLETSPSSLIEKFRDMLECAATQEEAEVRRVRSIHNEVYFLVNAAGAVHLYCVRDDIASQTEFYDICDLMRMLDERL